MIAGILNKHLEFQLVVFVVKEEGMDDPITKWVDGQFRDSQQVLLTKLYLISQPPKEVYRLIVFLQDRTTVYH